VADRLTNPEIAQRLDAKPMVYPVQGMISQDGRRSR
jgi:hypothetical protein